MSEQYFRQDDWYGKRKVMVEEEKLYDLLSICPRCCSQCIVEQVCQRGAYVKYRRTCLKCRAQSTWETSTWKNHTPLINIMLSFFIIFSGCLPKQFLRVLSHMNLLVPSVSTFQRYQRKYFHGVRIAVSSTYIEQKCLHDHQ